MAELSAAEENEVQQAELAPTTNDVEDNAFEFRLFAPAAKSSSTVQRDRNIDQDGRQNSQSENQITEPVRAVQRIRLESPGHDDSGATPIASRTARPIEYYISAPATPAERAQYAEAAISGELVKEIAKRPCPGLHLPWRVLSWPEAALKLNTNRARNVLFNAEKAEPGTTDSVSDRRRRTRKGKKTRLKIRRKIQAARVREEAKKAEEQAKQEKIKEKNRKINRKKQLKKRERQRELKKAEAETGVDPVDQNEIQVA